MSRRWNALVALAVVSLLAAGCGGADAAERERGSGSDVASGHGHAPGEIQAGEPADMSLFHVTSEWTDQTGATLGLEDRFSGRVHVVAMAYTNCAYACPRILLDMKRIEAAVPDVGFVLVTIDPERDTVERMLSFARGARLSPERWTLLRGSDGDLLELAAVLGVRYRRVSDTDFMHSNLLTVLNERGEIIHRQLELGDVDATVAAIRRHPGL